MNEAIALEDPIVGQVSSAASSAAPVPTVVGKAAGGFVKVKDARGRELKGLWRRNSRFYCQMEIPGKGTRRIPLRDAMGKPVATVAEAVKARHRLLQDREEGRSPAPQRTPRFADYVLHYLDWLESTMAKSVLTIKKERSSLAGWFRYLGETRLNQITRKTINEFVAKRTRDGVKSRTANLDVVALGNMLKFARNEGLLKGELPTENWTPLKYTPERRGLLSLEQIEKLCSEAASVVDGKPKHENGQFLADYIRFLAFSGARRQAALSAKWQQVDWTNRQLTLFTKFDKTVVVDFNEKLEAHLKDLFARRDKEFDWIFPSPRTQKKGQGFFANPQKLLNEVKADAGMPKFRFHDLRHYFISYCIMSGIDTMTVASWVGHADGGVLIGKTYGHLDPKHKRDAAAKLQFTLQAPTKAAPAPNASSPVLAQASTEELWEALQAKMAASRN